MNKKPNSCSNLTLEVHQTLPEGFVPQVQVAACYLEINQQLLLLQRAQGKLEGGKWSVPAGKLEENETPENAAKRELFEETGISVEDAHVQRLNALYIRKPEVDYIYYLFKVQLNHVPEVCLSDEHQSYRWANSNDIENIALMDGAREALQHYRTMVMFVPTPITQHFNK